MRPRLSRTPGLLLCAALAIAPNAWAAPSPVRTDLAQSQTTATEVRWQPIPQTETVTGPWDVVNSTFRVDQSQPRPQVQRFQEVRTDLLRQRTTTYPLEAKEQRTKTTTTQRYALQTFAEVSATSTVMVPVTKTVGAWVPVTEEVPVTAPVQVVSNEPRLVTVTVPVYRTVTSTYSVPSEPLLTPVSLQSVQRVPESTSVTRYRTETSTRTVREKYDGKAVSYCGFIWRNVTDHLKVSDDGLTIEYTSPVYFGSSNAGTPIRFKSLTAGPEDQRVTWTAAYKDQGRDYTSTLSLRDKGDHDEFDMVVTGPTACAPHLVLDAHLFRTQVTTTAQVPYTETVTRMVDVPTTATRSIQFETLVNAPRDLQGSPTRQGVFWRHPHGPGITCNFRHLIPVYRFGRADTSEYRAAMGSQVLGNVAKRLESLDPTEQKAFSLVGHHTSELPVFTDQLTPERVATKEERVYDHDETRTVWDYAPHWVTKQVPVKKVVRWIDMGPHYVYSHTHDDPSVRCDNQFLLPVAGRVQASYGYSQPSAYTTTRAPAPTYPHSRQPEFAPLTQKVTRMVRTLKTVTVMEPRTVTSTASILVKSVPGQEIRTSYSPWAATGDKRRAGAGTTREATRKRDVPGKSWLQDRVEAAYLDVPTVKAQASSFSSDRSTGGGRLTVNGNELRRRLKTREAFASRAQSAPNTGGSILTTVTPNQRRIGVQSAQSGTIPFRKRDPEQDDDHATEHKHH